MANVLPADRERIKRAGQWKVFLRERDILKASGMKPSDATRDTLAKILPLCPANDQQGEANEINTHGLPNDQYSAGASGESSTSSDALLALREKEGTITEIIKWVARNLSNPVPRAEDCPDPTAWELWTMCRIDPVFKATFMQNTWTKLIPSKSTFDESDDGIEIDGADQLRVIDQIEQASRNAKEKIA